MTEDLFISDLHLSPERPATTALFLGFLQGRARRARRLYILGDLFDSWIGDDDRAPPIPAVIAGLRDLGGHGTQVLVLHGNRDFLIGEAFMQASGATLLPAPHALTLAGEQTLLMHGDLLCSDDREYQQTRQLLRSEAFIRDFLSHPLEQRRAIAADYRRRSGEATSLKANEIMDVNPQTVLDTLRQHGATRLIHGHTHRPGIHDLTLDGKRVQRIVLAEWHEDQGSVLCVSDSGIASERVAKP